MGILSTGSPDDEKEEMTPVISGPSFPLMNTQSEPYGTDENAARLLFIRRRDDEI